MTLRSALRFPALAAALLAAFPLGAASFFHVPHDSVYGVAACLHAGGTEEIVTVSIDKTIYSTRDGGLTWNLITGAELEDEHPTAVSYNPTLPWVGATGGQGQFMIGTWYGGVFAYQPSDPGTAGTGIVRKLSRGGVGSEDILAMASPRFDAGSAQPTFLLTMDGRVYRLKPSLKSWEMVFDAGFGAQGAGALAMSPVFDVAGSGAGSTVLAAIGTQLFRSTQGGDPGTWTQVAQFNLPGNDWGITALAVDADYDSSPAARVYLGRTRKNGSRTDGELLVSTDQGQTFVQKLLLGTGLSSLATSGPGAGGIRRVFAAGRDYPNTNGFLDTGILHSDDRGDTWTDGGSWQSFLFENAPGERTGWKRLADNQQLLVLPDYAGRGRVAYGRNEGLFVSEDEGIVWREQIVRSIEGMRSVAAGQLADGTVKVYGASYGEGTISKDLVSGQEFLVEKGMSVLYQLPVAVSPDYANDGTVLVGGAKAMFAWYDPAVVPPQNPFGVLGVKTLPLENAGTGERLNQYIRSIAYSPHYTGTGSGGDQIVYFGGYQKRTYYTADGGRTYLDSTTTASGLGSLPYLTVLAIPPAFDSAPPHSDVYGIGTDGNLWRLTNGIWDIVAEVGEDPRALVIDPAWNAFSNRRLWVARKGGKPVVEVMDTLAGNASVTPLGGLPSGRGRGLAIADDAQGDRWLFCAMWSEGVFKRNLSAGTGWEALPTAGIPPTWTKGMAVSPDYANDRLVFVGTGRGIYSLADSGPGAVWQREFNAYVIDNDESSVVTWTGPAGTAPDPNLPWPWSSLKAGNVPGGGFGVDASVAQVDASYMLVRGLGTRVTLYTVAGEKTGANPVRAGQVTLTATHLDTGAVLAGTTVDLGALATGLVPYELPLDLGVPSVVPFELRLDASLDPGEAVLVDAFRVDY